jgi:anti-anti-sigma regulatory factor
MYETDVLLDHAVSSLVSSIVFDLSAVSGLNSIGSWTIFQVVFKAQEHGKLVYLYNVQPSIRSVLVEAGILKMARMVETKKELDMVLRECPQSSRSTGSLNHTVNMNGMRAEGF